MPTDEGPARDVGSRRDLDPGSAPGSDSAGLPDADGLPDVDGLSETPAPRDASLPLGGQRVALVHDWLTGMRGGEAVLEVLCRLLPDATLFTIVHRQGSVSPTIERHEIRESPLVRLPLARARYRHYLPLLPWAARRLDLRGFDLIVSTSHCVAKGVRTHGIPHWCYCHTPMRYVWDRFDDYFGRGRPLATRIAARMFRGYLRRWDRSTTDGITRLVANSRHVQDRIARYWGRDSDVIHPPVASERFRISSSADVGSHYLIVSALAPYKRLDLAIEAFRGTGRRLLIVGKGQEDRRLRDLARDTSVELLGWRSDEDVATLLSTARAFLLPGEEDFGITPLESMASGRPVIALGRGGALETVVDLMSRGEPATSSGAGARRVADTAGEPPATGVLFREPTVASLRAALERFESHEDRFDPQALRDHARRFDTAVFRARVREDLERFVRDRLPASR